MDFARFLQESEDQLNDEDVTLVYGLLMKSVILEIIKLTDPSFKIDENSENILEGIKSTIEITGKILSLIDEAENISKVEDSNGHLSDLVYIKISDLQNAIDENVNESSSSKTSTNEVFKNYLSMILEGLPEGPFAYEDDIVLTSEPDMFYLKQMAKLIRDTPTSHLEMYLWWTIVEDL